jgi:hypothetical protein
MAFVGKIVSCLTDARKFAASQNMPRDSLNTTTAETTDEDPGLSIARCFPYITSLRFRRKAGTSRSSAW